MADSRPSASVVAISGSTLDPAWLALMQATLGALKPFAEAGGNVTLEVHYDSADEIKLLKEANAKLAARVAELEAGHIEPPPAPLYMATVTAAVNVRDETGADLHEQLPIGTRLSVWSEGVAGAYTDRAYIDRANVGRNVWLKNIQKDTIHVPNS